MFLQNLNYSKLRNADTQTKEVSEVEVQTVFEEPTPMAPVHGGASSRSRALELVSESIASEEIPSGDVPTASVLDASISSVIDEDDKSGSRSPSDMKTESIVRRDAPPRGLLLKCSCLPNAFPSSVFRQFPPPLYYLLPTTYYLPALSFVGLHRGLHREWHDGNGCRNGNRSRIHQHNVTE